MKPSRTVRRLLFAGVTFAVGILLLLTIGRRYARNEVISQLTEINGAPVTIETVDFGFRRHHVRGVRMLQAGDRNVPWLTVDSIELELSVWEALRGRAIPHCVVVRDASVLLQFGEDGSLLTRLPVWQDRPDLAASVISADVIGGRLEIQQVGRDPLAVKAIDLRLRPAKDRLQLAGSVGDLLGSKWLLSCTADPQSKQASWKASTDRLRVNTQIVEKLPLVPPGLSSDVAFEVASPVEATGAYEPGRELQYRLQLAPSDIDVAAQDLALTDGRGDIVIENGSVTVSHLIARVFGGSVHLDGSLDLGKRQGNLVTRIDAVELQRLPKSWKLPDEVTGVFSGSGQFDVAISDVGTSIRGNGTGRVAEASILGLPVEPIVMQVVVEPVASNQQDAESVPAYAGQIHLELAMDQVPLAEMIERFDTQPVEGIGDLAGRLSFRGWLRAPLSPSVQLTDLEAGGNLRLGGLKVGGNELQELRSEFALSAGKLELQRLRAVVGGGGEVQGNASIDLSAASPVINANVDLARLPIALLSDLFPAEYPVSGTVSGQAKTVVPVQSWNDLRTWQVSGTANSQQLDVGKWSLAGTTTRVQLEDGKLSFTETRAQWLGSSVEGSLSLDVAGGFPFESQFVANEVPIGAAIESVGRELPVTLAGFLSVRGDAQGTLSPFTWKASGVASLPKLTTGDWQIDAADGEWKANASALTIARGQASFLGGQVDLTGTVPLENDSGVRLRGTFRQIAPTRLVQKIAPEFDPGIGLTGFLSGEFSASDIQNSETAAADIRFAGLSAQLRDAVLEDVVGQASYRDSMLSAEVQGKAFGGTVAFRGQGQAPDKSLKNTQVEGRLTFSNADMSRVASAFKGQLPAGSVQGTAKGQLDVQINGPQFQPEGVGRLVLENVKWDNAALAKLVTSEVLLSKEMLRFVNVSTSVARGSVSGTVSLDLARPGEGTFRLAADRIALDELPVTWPSSLGRMKGSLAASLSGRIGRPWRGTGQLRLANATVAGVPIQSLRAPMDWAYSPRSASVQSRIRFTSARIARGRINGDLAARWSGSLDLEGKVKFVNVDMRTLARATPAVNDLLSGRTTGQVQFKGVNVKSFDNLSGTYSAELTQSQALLFPVLEDLTSSLGFSSPASATFSKTEAKGRFRRGTVKVERMTMESTAAQLFIDGEINTRGNLDFNVTADTAQAAAVGVVIGVLRPTDLLRRRLVFLHVGGSIRAPVIQPRVAEFIEQEIMLFFLPFGTPM